MLRKRLFAILIAVTFLFLFVIGRLFYVQIVWGKDLQEKAIDQWTREIPIIAPRGIITDRNGTILADNQDTYSVFVRKSGVKNIEKVATALSSILDMDYSYVLSRLTKTISSEVTIKKQVSKSQIQSLQKYNFSGVYYSRDNTRVYPYNEMLASVLGFTSNDSKGQAGIELYYNKYLEGKNGEILYETDIVGKELEDKKASYIPAIDGLNIKLTIDFDIQMLVESAMAKAMQMHKCKSASMLVLDPNSGEILALANLPSLNLNDLPRDDLDSLNKLSRNTLISDVYEPGSTFKILTAAANIEESLQGNKNAYNVNHVYSSSRYRYIDGQRVRCWSDHKNGKHQGLTLEGALNNSCNPIFVDIAMSLGKETMYKYIDLFNYGKATGVDFLGESSGMVLPITAVQNVDLARIAFGQTIAVTGLQLASATAAAINGGYYFMPRLIKQIYSKEGIVLSEFSKTLKNRVISEEASSILNSLLEKVVSEGSGKNAYIDGYRVAGKTGDILTTCVNLVKNLIKIYT